ncbi:MAG: beta-N-acetylhexosaminidase [Candidatus Hodarchaeota archaeon]
MKLSIFPDPVKITEKTGSFKLSKTLLGFLKSPPVKFKEYSSFLATFNVLLVVAPGEKQIEGIGTEGYTMVVSPENIIISANTEAGCYYGIQTLRWLLPPRSLVYEIPCCEILDYPRYPYRGYMLDEARYFLGMDTVKSVLDWMALLKLNRFHWHLTEDQGWRVEIKKYPKLVEVGSKRASTPISGNNWRYDKDDGDGIPHEGFYTQDQIREIIDYAAVRHITIIPEIEMPGHATAALASYPEVRCTLPDDFPPEGAHVFGRFLDGPNINVSSYWGVHSTIFCVGNPKAVEFIQDVLKEVSDLFPSPIIHIGGDEVPKVQWICCNRCQGKKEELGLSTEEDLQIAFTADIIDYLASLGKKTMLWNEHSDDSLAERKEHVICQYWTGRLEKVNGFIEQGGNLVMSPSSHVYVDHAYHFLPLKRMYHYDPMGIETLRSISELAAEKADSGGILGVEAEMWGEVFQNREQVEYCTFPRIFALVDIAWKPQDAKNYDRFLERLPPALERLDAMGITHATLEQANPSDEAIEQETKNPKFGTYMYFD